MRRASMERTSVGEHPALLLGEAAHGLGHRLERGDEPVAQLGEHGRLLASTASAPGRPWSAILSSAPSSDVRFRHQAGSP